MGEIIKTKINRWEGGITNDPRSSANNVARMVTGFDIFSEMGELVPTRSLESGDANASTSKKQAFCIAYWPLATAQWKLFGLGVVSGSAKASIHMKTLDGVAGGLWDATWTDPSGNAQTVGTTTSFNLFTYYKKTGLIYGARDGSHIWTFQPGGGVGSFTDSAHALTYTNISQGLVHSKDDVLYIPYDNKIASNNNGSWTDAALTLPSSHYITSICERGNYLAIACAPLAGVGNSVVFLWDRDSSLTTLSESIDWGSGSLKILEEVDGFLIGVSIDGAESTTAIRNNDRIVFRYYSQGGAVKFKELSLDVITDGYHQLPIFKQKVDGRLYFMMRITYNGVIKEGVWSVGKIGQSISLAHEKTPNNDVALTSGVMRGFFIVGDYMFIAYSSGASVYNLMKTDNSSTAYAASSIYESKIFNTGDSSLKKDLVGVTVSTEPLPVAGQIILKYRTDHNTAWTTIFTESTDNSISHSAVNIESTGATLPKDYKEIQFQILSTGGAEITELSFNEEITGKRSY